MMPGQRGITYKAKYNDHMDKVLVRPCPTCGAKVGELCVTLKTKRPVVKIENVHTARFRGRDEKKAKTMATHWAVL